MAYDLAGSRHKTVGATVGAIFGTAWAVVALSALPRDDRAFPRIAIITAGLSLSWLAFDLKHKLEKAGPGRKAEEPRSKSVKMGALVAIEAIFIVVGASLIQHHHQHHETDWFIAYLLAVVGIHLLPMARILHSTQLTVVGLVLTVCAASCGAAVAADTSRAYWLGVPTGVAAAALLIPAVFTVSMSWLTLRNTSC